MIRLSTAFAALSLLVAPVAPAFAGEGTFQQTVVASPASGPAADRSILPPFAFNVGAGNYGDIAAPASPQGASGTIRLGSFGFNAGHQG